MTENTGYHTFDFTTWSCTKCGEIFRIEDQQGEKGPVACPICGYTNYDSSGFEKIMEPEFVQEKEETFDELKHFLEKALYRSRKL